MNDTERTPLVLHLRLSDEQAKRIDALAARFPGAKSVLARRALEIGMDAIEKDPAAFARSAPASIVITHDEEESSE